MSITTNEIDDDVVKDASDDAEKNAVCVDKKEMEHEGCHVDLLSVDRNDGGEPDSNLTAVGSCRHETKGFCDTVVTGSANSDPLFAQGQRPCNNTESKYVFSSRNEHTPDTQAIVGTSDVPHRLRTSTPCEAEENCPRDDSNDIYCRAGMKDSPTDSFRLSASPNNNNVLWKLHSFVATLGEAVVFGLPTDPIANQGDATKKFSESPKSLTANTSHDQTIRYQCHRGVCPGIKSGSKRPNVPNSPSRRGNAPRCPGPHSAGCYTSHNTVIDRPCNVTQTLSLLGSLKNCFSEQEQPLDLSLRRPDPVEARHPTNVTSKSSLLRNQSTTLPKCLPLLSYSMTMPPPNKVLNQARPMHMLRFPPTQVHLGRARNTASVRLNKFHAKSTETKQRRWSVAPPLQGKRQPLSHHKPSFSSSGDRARRDVKDSRRPATTHGDQPNATRRHWSAAKTPLSPGQRRRSQYQCNCGAAFETLYQQAVHMEATGHCPSRKEPSVSETFEYQKLVRGQDLWLNYGSEQAREILRCMRCQRSFESLSELTLHMIRTKHYEEIVGSSCSGGNSIFGDTIRDKQKQNLIVANEVVSSVSQRHLAVNGGTSKARRVDSKCIEKKKELDEESENYEVPCISNPLNRKNVASIDCRTSEVSASALFPYSGKTSTICDAAFKSERKPRALEELGQEQKNVFDLQSTNDKATMKITDHVAVEVILKVITDATHQIGDDSTLKSTDDTIINVTDDATLKMPEDPSLHVTVENTIKVNEDDTIKVTDDFTKKVIDDTTIKVTSHATMKLTDDSTLNVGLIDANLVVTGNAVLTVIEDAPMQVIDGATVRVTTDATLKVTDDPSAFDVETPNITEVDCSASNAELAMQKTDNSNCETIGSNNKTNIYNNEINGSNNESNENKIRSKTVTTTDSDKTDLSSDGHPYSIVCKRQNDCMKRKQITARATCQVFIESDEFKVPTPKKRKRSVPFEAETHSSELKGSQQPTADVCKKSMQPLSSSSTSVHFRAIDSLAASTVATESQRIRSRKPDRFSGHVSNRSSAITCAEKRCTSPELSTNRFVGESGNEKITSAIDAMQQFIAKSFLASCSDLSESEPFELRTRSETNRETHVTASNSSCASRASLTRWIYGDCNRREEESYQQLHSGSSREERLIDTSSALKRNKKHPFIREFCHGRNSESIVSGVSSKSNKVTLRTQRCHEPVLANSNDYRLSRSEASDRKQTSSVTTAPQDSGLASSAVQIQEIKDAAKIENSQGSLQTELMSRDDKGFEEFEDNTDSNDSFLSTSAPPSIRSVPSDSRLDTFAPEQSTCEVYKQGENKTGEGCKNLVCKGGSFQDIDRASSPSVVNFQSPNTCIKPGCKLQTPESVHVQNKRKITRTSDTSSLENLRPRGPRDEDHSSSIKDLIKTSPYVYLPLDHSAIFTKYTSSWVSKESRTSNKCHSHNPSQPWSQNGIETAGTLNNLSPKSESGNKKQATSDPNSTITREGETLVN